MTKIALVSIGTELLEGIPLPEPNASFIADSLFKIGLPVGFMITAGDDKDDLLKTLEWLFAESDLIITTGGLGPTPDDLTCEVLAEITGQELIYRQDIWDNIQLYFKEKCIELPMINKKQAFVPKDAKIIQNLVGTAPGLILEHKNTTIISLPGPPSEVRDMWKNFVLNFIQEKFLPSQIYSTCTLKFCGIQESRIAELVGDALKLDRNPKLYTLAKPGEIHLKIVAYGKTIEESDNLLHKTKDQMIERLKYFYIGQDEDTLESKIGKLLIEKGLTISVAESCTAGLLGSRITNISGSSSYFKGGVIAYSNEIKEGILKVSKDILIKKGAVSEEVASSMAEGVRKIMQSDIGLSITGIAGPTGATKNKPVGLVYVGLSTSKDTLCKKYNFKGERNKIRFQSAQAALNLLRLYLEERLKELEL